MCHLTLVVVARELQSNGIRCVDYVFPINSELSDKLEFSCGYIGNRHLLIEIQLCPASEPMRDIFLSKQLISLSKSAKKQTLSINNFDR